MLIGLAAINIPKKILSLGMDHKGKTIWVFRIDLHVLFDLHIVVFHLHAIVFMLKAYHSGSSRLALSRWITKQVFACTWAQTSMITNNFAKDNTQA